MSQLPPLKSVQAFEAVARHLSFSKAANELCVSQSAVSHQIRTLEQFLNKKVFLRVSNSVQLTQHGELYFAVLTDCFSRMREITDHLLEESEVQLRVICQTSFAVEWLAPRLPFFQKKQPRINVNLSMAANAEHYDPSLYDISIGAWPCPANYASKKIRTESWYPVFTEQMKNRIDLDTPSSVIEQPLISSENGQDWKQWIQQFDLRSNPKTKFMHVSHTLLAAKAALSGEGIALACDFLVADAIDYGHLLAAKELSYSPDWGNYYIHYQPNAFHSEKMRVFIDWVMDTCKRFPR
jgi:DNA-binding transcriptional LysR family regulator